MKTASEYGTKPSFLAIELGIIIKKKRLSIPKLTQKKLALQSGLEQAYLSKIERGKINIKIDTLVNIADALGTSVDKLLLDASSYVEPDYISQITYHLSKLSREDQERLLWHLEQNNVFEIKKKALLKL